MSATSALISLYCHAAVEDLFRKLVDAVGGQWDRDMVADSG